MVNDLQGWDGFLWIGRLHCQNYVPTNHFLVAWGTEQDAFTAKVDSERLRRRTKDWGSFQLDYIDFHPILLASIGWRVEDLYADPIPCSFPWNQVTSAQSLLAYHLMDPVWIPHSLVGYSSQYPPVFLINAFSRLGGYISTAAIVRGTGHFQRTFLFTFVNKMAAYAAFKFYLSLTNHLAYGQRLYSILSISGQFILSQHDLKPQDFWPSTTWPVRMFVPAPRRVQVRCEIPAGPLTYYVALLDNERG